MFYQSEQDYAATCECAVDWQVDIYRCGVCHYTVHRSWHRLAARAVYIMCCMALLLQCLTSNTCTTTHMHANQMMKKRQCLLHRKQAISDHPRSVVHGLPNEIQNGIICSIMAWWRLRNPGSATDMFQLVAYIIFPNAYVCANVIQTEGCIQLVQYMYKVCKLPCTQHSPKPLTSIQHTTLYDTMCIQL